MMRGQAVRLRDGLLHTSCSTLHTHKQAAHDLCWMPLPTSWYVVQGAAEAVTSLDNVKASFIMLSFAL